MKRKDVYTTSPLNDYALLDFGVGRKLEHFGDVKKLPLKVSDIYRCLTR